MDKKFLFFIVLFLFQAIGAFAFKNLNVSEDFLASFTFSSYLLLSSFTFSSYLLSSFTFSSYSLLSSFTQSPSLSVAMPTTSFSSFSSSTKTLFVNNVYRLCFRIGNPAPANLRTG